MKLTPRDTAFSWVPAKFDTIASQVYKLLGSLMCSAETAWDTVVLVQFVRPFLAFSV
jgi:hypothetical protein